MAGRFTRCGILFLFPLGLTIAATNCPGQQAQPAGLPDAANACAILPNQPAQSLTGAVTDSSGARIPSAIVSLTCGSVALQAHTDTNGAYSFKTAPGTYTLKVDSPGFASSTQQITVAVGSNPDYNVSLSIAQASNSVTVNGDAGYVAVNSTTGTKTNVPLIETPQAISVVTRDQIDEQGAQSVPQALRYTAGVLPEWRGVDGDGLETINGRGFTLPEYLDGLILPFGEYNVPAFDQISLERVEILHGPASVLYGQAAPGGLVNIVSKQPRHQAYRDVEFQAGNFDRYQGSVDFSGPFLQNKYLYYRLTGLARDTNTQVDHIEQQRYLIAPALTWQPDENTSLTAILNYQYDPKAGIYNFVPAAGTVLPNPNGEIPTSLDVGDPDFDRHARRQYMAEYLFTHRFNSIWAVHQNFRYIHLTDHFTNVFAEGFGADNRTLTRYSFLNDEYTNESAVDNQVTATLVHGQLQQTILAGVDYQNIPSSEAYGFNFNAPGLDAYAPVYSQAIPAATLSGHDLVGQYQVGVYGQDQIRYGKWAFTLGGREDWAGTHDHEIIGGTVEDQEDHAFSGRAGAVYILSRGIAPYFSYSTSFQPDLGVNFAGAPFKPTTGQQYEAGVKLQPSNFNGFITIAAFNLTEQNVTTTDPLHPQFSTQTGEIRSRGVELEGHANFTNNLSMIASYTFLDNVVTKSNDTDAAYGNDLGKTPYATPENTAGLWMDYTAHRGLASGMNIGAGVRLVGQSYGNDLDTLTVPSNTLIDAAFHYDLKTLSSDLTRWRLSMNASNLADRRYVASCSSTTNCIFGFRRSLIGTVDFKW